jgi:hypothetical protein
MNGDERDSIESAPAPAPTTTVESTPAPAAHEPAEHIG